VQRPPLRGRVPLPQLRRWPRPATARSASLLASAAASRSEESGDVLARTRRRRACESLCSSLQPRRGPSVADAIASTSCSFFPVRCRAASCASRSGGPLSLAVAAAHGGAGCASRPARDRPVARPHARGAVGAAAGRARVGRSAPTRNRRAFFRAGVSGLTPRCRQSADGCLAALAPPAPVALGCVPARAGSLGRSRPSVGD
jgi:hypothetical protein